MLRSIAEVAFVQSKLAATTGAPENVNNEHRIVTFTRDICTDDHSFIATFSFKFDNVLILAMFLSKLL
jgi:hypothetical protein